MNSTSKHKARISGPVDVHVGRVLRQLRLDAKYSQDHLAELTGVTCAQIQKYEKGVNRVGASRLFLLSQIFEVTPDKFFEGLSTKDTNNDKPLLSARFFEHPRGAKLATAFLEVNNPKWENEIITLCRSLSKLSNVDS